MNASPLSWRTANLNMLESHTLGSPPTLSNFALVQPMDFQEVTTNLPQHQDYLVQRISEWVFKNGKL